MRKRTRSRELALQILYQYDARGDDAIDQMDHFLQGEEPGEPEVHEFARKLVDGTRNARDGIDELLAAAAENWKLHRMAIVDRNILRMAVYEMLHLEEIQTAVSRELHRVPVRQVLRVGVAGDPLRRDGLPET